MFQVSKVDLLSSVDQKKPSEFYENQNNTITRAIPKDFFRTCNVLPFSCTHLALWRGNTKQKGFKNFFRK